MERSYQPFINSCSRTTRYSFPLLVVLFSTTYFVVAQPHDREHYYQKTAREISVLSGRISQKPNEANLYYERAKLFLGWFPNHRKVVEHKGVVYATDPGLKALSDIELAIELDPRGEFFTLRGRYYEADFQHQVGTGPDEKAAEWREMERMYWENDSLARAVENYHKGLENTREPNAKAEALLRLSDLFSFRANAMAFYSLAKVVSAANKSRLVFEDFDRSIEFLKRYAETIEPKYGVTSRVRDLYRDKARAAAVFEDRPEGLRSLTAGINVLKEMGEEEESCSLYLLRGDQYLKGRDITKALSDYTYPLENKLPNCFSIYEKRGDAYVALGQLDTAIADYTREISGTSYPPDRIFLKRGRIYLNIGNAEKAEADLSHVLRFGSTCEEPRTLRAKAYRLLKKDKLADDDDKTAKAYARNKLGCRSLYSDQ